MKAKKRKRYPDPLRMDPTRTTDLRQRFAKEFQRRFTALKRAVRELIVKEDAFGLKEPVTNVFCPTGPEGAAEIRAVAPDGSVSSMKLVESSIGEMQNLPVMVGQREVRERISQVVKEVTTPEERALSLEDQRKAGLLDRVWTKFCETPFLSKTMAGETRTARYAYTRTPAQPTTNTRFKFNTTSEQVKQFQAWLQRQVNLKVLNKPGVGEDLWLMYWNKEAYRRGMDKTFDKVRKSSLYKAKPEFFQGSKQEYMRQSFGSPAAIDKLRLLAGRTFTDLEGVTQEMSTQMSRRLTDGLLRGSSPEDIAEDLVDRVEHIGITRARVIARTEIIRAHAEGALDAMESLGVESVGVAVEWSTSGFNVCEKCAALEGVILTVAEARGLFPRHPNCRCSPIPANVGEDREDQVRDKEGIDEAFAESSKEDDWVEEDEELIDEERPESVL